MSYIHHTSSKQSTFKFGKDEILPRVTRDGNGADGAANHADLSSNVLGDDTQKTQEICDGGLFRRLNAVAALKGAGVALIGRRAAGRNEGGESKGGEGGEDGKLHI